jgi:hypothetical protein
MLISSRFPIIIIIGIILTTISARLEISFNNNISWISIIIIILFVGGLIIVYIFILSINSNQKMKTKTKTIFIIPISFLIVFLIKNQLKIKIESGSIIFSLNWEILIIIIASILATIIIISKIIFHPSIPTKRIK